MIAVLHWACPIEDVNQLWLYVQGGNKVNVVNQLLTELDGFDSRKQVYVIGATNRLGLMIRSKSITVTYDER